MYPYSIPWEKEDIFRFLRDRVEEISKYDERLMKENIERKINKKLRDKDNYVDINTKSEIKRWRKWKSLEERQRQLNKR